MKKFLLSAILMPWCLCACQPTHSNNIKNNEIYLFYFDACPHCHSAIGFLKQNYPNLKINKIDVKTKSGHQLFLECASKHKLGKNIGTPLFCMGENYIMGWSQQSIIRFKTLVRPFLK